ncbi:MAG: hypothetical protein R6X02_11435 [Enhygromyxa sp.]
MILRVRERVPGFDPAGFWQAAPGPDRWQAMIDKYATLAALARLSEDRRAPTLREAASRWPGSLREAELIGPAQVDARASAARAGLARPDLPRESWTEEPALAVVCWAELHGLIEDQLRFRAEDPRRAGDSEAFAAWIARRDPSGRWPDPARLPAVVGPKLRVRSAYLWLAARAGLDLPGLNALLLARAGHWDRRADDPPWAHD